MSISCLLIVLLSWYVVSIVSETSADLLSLINSPSTNNNNKPLCYTKSTDILHQPLPGHWIHGTYENPGVFAKDHNVKDWWFNACPTQMAIFSCYKHDTTNLLEGHGYAANHRKYEMDTCRLNSFSPTSFLRMMQDRKLIVCCDSVAMQIFSLIVCSLHGTTTADYSKLEWLGLGQFGAKDCVDGTGIHCHLQTSHIYYPEFNFTFFYFGTHTRDIRHRLYFQTTFGDYMKEANSTSPRDIFLLNHGVHMRSHEMMATYCHTLAKEYHEMSPQTRPIFIWRETLAQHFDNSQSNTSIPGYFSRGNKLPCTPYQNLEDAKEKDYHNQIPNKIFEAYKIPILRVYNASAIAFDQHIGPQIRTDEAGMQDCTHYCENAGIYYYVRDLFYNLLHVLV